MSAVSSRDALSVALAKAAALAEDANGGFGLDVVVVELYVLDGDCVFEKELLFLLLSDEDEGVAAAEEWMIRWWCPQSFRWRRLGRRYLILLLVNWFELSVLVGGSRMCFAIEGRNETYLNVA